MLICKQLVVIYIIHMYVRCIYMFESVRGWDITIYLLFFTVDAVADRINFSGQFSILLDKQSALGHLLLLPLLHFARARLAAPS